MDFAPIQSHAYLDNSTSKKPHNTLKPMKTFIVRTSLLFAIATLFCATSLQAQNRSSLYTGVTVGFTTTSWSDVDDGYAIGAVFGAVLKERHHIEGEVMYIENKMSDYYDKVRYRHIPILATYRYGILFGETGWSLELGGSLGAVSKKLHGWYHAWMGFACGAQALAIYKINPHVSVNAGLRTLWTAKTGVYTSGAISMFTVGATFRF